MTAPAARRRPGPLVRGLGRAVNTAVTTAPWAWPLLRAPVRRFFDAAATGWDERVRPDTTEYLQPLMAALDHLPTSPGRILDIGTGTGAAAVALANRYPGSDVLGIDVSARMIAHARARIENRRGRVRFIVADITVFADDEGFDLITMLNMPPFLDRVVSLLKPAGVVLNASSHGPRTPFFTPPVVLKRGFERRGLRTIAATQAGAGTYYLAGRP